MRESLMRLLMGMVSACVVVGLPGCAATEPAWLKDDAKFSGPAWTDPAPHRAGRANVRDTALAYLDWGVRGRPMIMVHGLGGNAHEFDDLAALLRDRFRVIAYSRRGHGDSEESWKGYDADTLCEDLGEFMDRAGVERAILVGWGTGGAEITRFAELHPERVEAVVYLDAGYDYSDPSFTNSFEEALAARGPGAAETRSLDAYRAWFHETWLGPTAWTAGLESFLRNNAVVGPDGAVAPRPVAQVSAAALEALKTTGRNYAAVKAPALALYAERYFPEGVAGDWEARVMAPFRTRSMERLRREMPGATVLEIPGTTHVSIGAGSPASAARLIAEFLSAPAPPAQ